MAGHLYTGFESKNPLSLSLVHSRRGRLCRGVHQRGAVYAKRKCNTRGADKASEKRRKTEGVRADAHARHNTAGRYTATSINEYRSTGAPERAAPYIRGLFHARVNWSARSMLTFLNLASVRHDPVIGVVCYPHHCVHSGRSQVVRTLAIILTGNNEVHSTTCFKAARYGNDYLSQGSTDRTVVWNGA